MVGAEVGVAFGNAFGLARKMPERAVQACPPAGSLHLLDDVDGRRDDRLEVMADYAVPLAGNFHDRIRRVLDRIHTGDLRQPAASGNPLVQHGCVHHEQGGDGAAVRLRLALVFSQLIQPKMAVEQRVQLVPLETSPRLVDAVFEDVDVTLGAVAGGDLTGRGG